jgi:hypothetical protein
MEQRWVPFALLSERCNVWYHMIPHFLSSPWNPLPFSASGAIPPLITLVALPGCVDLCADRPGKGQPRNGADYPLEAVEKPERA